MKRITILSALVVSLFILPGAYAGTTEENEIREWEYKVTRPKAFETQAQEYLNNLGKEGWELVAVIGNAEQLSGVRYYFKRPKK